MRTLALFATLALAAPAFAADAAPADKKTEAPKKGKKAEAKKVDATVGQKADAKWTDTTDKAAATPEQKKQLKKGKPATVTGEVIDVSCFLQLGKRGEKHVACGTKCIQNGQPIGIVDDRGDVYVLFAEAHDPRRDGQVDLKATFLPLLAKRVTVSGMVQDQKGSRALFVDSSALSAAPATATTPAAAPTGATGASGAH
ncbi:MAG: hypothetical protein ACYDCL_21350 [Myxococcales bacterium]